MRTGNHNPVHLRNRSSATGVILSVRRYKSYDGHRYVNLGQINPGNVAQLKEVCTFDSGVAAPAQSTPVLYEGRIYFSVGTTTVALDASNCKEIWRHAWELKGKALSNPNRGVAIKDGRLLRGTPDGFLIALDMADGKLIWERQITSAQEGHYLSMPAMIVGDVVIYGTAGADWGGRGWIGAFKLEDGEELWRYDALPKPGEPDAQSWGADEALAHGGGSFWTPVSVDREKNLVYVPVGNPAPTFSARCAKAPISIPIAWWRSTSKLANRFGGSNSFLMTSATGT
jgi:alcohol dehydrogenase (cytochrome c)